MIGTTPLSRALSFLLPALLSIALHAQSGKAFYKEGEKLRQAQQLEKALEQYTLAIQVDPGMSKAYVARADVYQQLGKKQECANDRKRLAELDPSEPAYAASAAKAFLDLDDPTTARALTEAALRVDPKHLEALVTKTRACLLLGDLDAASATADAALAAKATTDTYYMHGVVHSAMRDYKTAEFDLEKVIEWNYLYEDAYVALAEVQLALCEQYSGPTMQMRTIDKALQRTTTALELNPQSTSALFTRSKAYAWQKEYAKAIDDISRCIALGRTDRDAYFQRATYYHGYGQHQNAINDLNQLLLKDPKDVQALLLRAECKEANVDLEGALADLDAAKKLMQADPAARSEDLKKLQAQRDRVAQTLFELNREEDPPLITVVEPYRLGDVVQVSSALQQVKVTGHVRDKNLLKSITVNGADADFATDEKDPEFFISVPFGSEAKKVEVEARDVYDNVATVSFNVVRTEGIAPEVAVTLPVPTGDRQITVEADQQDLFLEGRAHDGSILRAITVDGVFASFIPDTNNTDFSIKLDIKGKDRLTVHAEDQYGNGTDAVYVLVRKAPAVAVVKPSPTNGGGGAKPAEKPAEKPTDRPNAMGATGITWVVYIENNDYKGFPAVGSGSDQSKMQKAFSKYNVQKTINKKNLSKAQIERFFNIELRDLVRTNGVNTVLVWYTGHGRTVGGKSYWIPVDGKKDDIYSFYNYGPLKSLIQNYSASVNNTLVVSDAAGSEASFYDLTR